MAINAFNAEGFIPGHGHQNSLKRPIFRRMTFVTGNIHMFSIQRVPCTTMIKGGNFPSRWGMAGSTVIFEDQIRKLILMNIDVAGCTPVRDAGIPDNQRGIRRYDMTGNTGNCLMGSP